MSLQALLDAVSPAKRTRLQVQDSPSRQTRVAAKRTEQLDALERDLKQVMNYADEKVCFIARCAWAYTVGKHRNSFSMICFLKSIGSALALLVCPA